MISYVKNAYKTAKNVYEYKALQILEYLDKELKYEESLKHYTDQNKLKKLSMEYDAYKFKN